MSAVVARQGASEGRTHRVWRVASVLCSVALVAAVFVFAIPKIADYGVVWATIRRLTPFGSWSLLAATVVNLAAWWWANMAALPGLTPGRAAVLTQTTTTVANTLPGGGAIAVGLTYRILRSWGFDGTDVALYVGVTGIWNVFTKLALPVLSISVLAMQGTSDAAYVTAAVVGLVVLAAAVVVLVAACRSEALARRVGGALAGVASALRRIVRRPPVPDGPDRAAAFRVATIALVGRRWGRLTVRTVLGHLSLFAVLLLAIRAVGVPEGEVGTAAIFATFAFGRLLAALPVTPGGLGVIELGYIAGLVAAGAPKPEAVAGVLVFRALTFALQIPLGGVTYAIWRAKATWRAPAVGEPAPRSAVGVPAR